MIKNIFRFLITILLFFVISYFSHEYMITSNNNPLSFSLLSLYVFHAFSAVLIYSIVVLISEKLPNQAGYAYLASIFLKIGFFVLLFKASVFANDSLTKIERFSLVIPLFLFLIIEAIGVSKLLNNK
ncbi:DUF6168 family protein [Tenacibaculum maritimum]|uniref:DUF6168 family protein n=1 Tax=Tenacibaculum maritimum TaxID=107401 RepID=UPI0012E48267|nr:DUF6168 family protein [Tenacibaculum maritimum]CAA0179574.1 putative membrane protein [Tenacibaculum maritimum]CAA0211577.1 putative membrane protein [Tenacibaculum maritimum]